MSLSNYNKILLLKNVETSLEEYFKDVHIKYYSNIDISHVDFLIEICEKDNEFIVHYT
jgi:hypothetical protein